MTVAPLIAMKSTKCESLEAVGKELDRRAHTYANDVDQSGRHVGYLCRAGDESPVPLEQAIERRMGELNTKRKIMEVDMNGIVAENGKVVTDEMIAGWESALERDEWPSGWVNVGEIVEGKLPKAAPETVTLSLKVPAAMKRALEKEAKAEGKSTGAYARGILADGLMAIA